MTPHFFDGRTALYHGDALSVLAGLAPGIVDSVVTDPPYGLEFMGREWDGADGFRRSLNGADAGRESVFGRTSRTSPEYRAGTLMQQWCEAWAAQCLRVLKPGGYLLAFGGTRTSHRMACAIEDAGFEIRDSIAWLYGSGFPKSLDVSKAIDKAGGAEREVVGTHYLGTGSALPLTAPATDDAKRWEGWGTALKPAHEPIIVARKPLVGTVAANVLAHGTGALNIDACRVEAVGRPLIASRADVSTGIFGDGLNGSRHAGTTDTGRWPTNVLLDGDAAAELDEQSGTLKSGANPARRGSDKFRDTYGEFTGQAECVPARGADSGGASRFFPTFRYQAKAPTKERPKVDGVAHPTVKPLELMRWLVRLVTQPNGIVLDPFAGSGTTAEACRLEGFRCITIEREATYLPLIAQRVVRTEVTA